MKAEVRMKDDEWKTVALGDLVEPAKTWNPSRSPSDETFDYIDLSAVDQDAKLITGPREISCGEAPSRARQLVARGDVLVSTVRPNLNGVARVPDQLDGATASTGFCVLRARESKFDGGYLFHWVKSPAFVADMVNKATGASYPAVSDRIIFDSRIPLPPLAEQRRIAEVLDRAEALRAKRRAALAQLDSLTQSLFLDLFGDPATNPKGFPVRRLGELIVDGPQNGLYKPSTDYGSGTPILRIDAFYDGAVTDISALKRVRLSDAEKNGFRLTENDVVINRVNSLEYLGKCALIPKLSEETVFESNMMRMRFDSETAHPRFVVQFLQSGFAKSQIQMRAKHAVNQASINQQDVSGFRTSVPPSPCSANSPAG